MTRVESKRLKLSQRLDAHYSVCRQTEFARQGLDCALSSVDATPRPHNSSPVWG